MKAEAEYDLMKFADRKQFPFISAFSLSKYEPYD